MFFARRHREVPELNTTSTADISFMLLIFFLVTSSMNADKGLSRQLPPLDSQQAATVDINRSNVLQIRLDGSDRLWIDQQPATLDQLRQQVASFVASRQSDQFVVGVQTDRQTSYEAYFNMQNAIVAAFHQLRDHAAQQRYGHRFEQCTPEERGAIVQRYPLRVSEAQPSEEGGRP